MQTQNFKSNYGSAAKESFSSQNTSFYKKNGKSIEGGDDMSENNLARKKRLMKEANWDDLLFWDKIRLFDIWSIISMLANIT